MNLTLTEQNLNDFAALRTELRHHLTGDSIFNQPGWLEAWWQEFGSGAKEYLRVVKQDGKVIGIAPLLIKEGQSSFIGSADICDYLDFIIAPGKEQDFFTILLDDLRKEGVSALHLESLRHDSTVLANLVDMAKDRGYAVSCNHVNVSLGVDLPHTWEEYLDMLAAKQRHEVKRKLRRLHEAGDIKYRTIEDTESVQDAMDIFLKLLKDSREDKSSFMTTRMKSFFKSIAAAMASDKLLRLGILELDTLPVAAVMCFDYNDTVYLYNSGYDTQYSSLSVGLLSKVLSIKDSIERGKKRFDFLKGAEAYKYRLGGTETPIYNCQIALK